MNRLIHTAACFLLVLFASICTQAQNHLYTADSAAIVMDRFVTRQNLDAFKADSILYIETTILNNAQGKRDTLRMRRWAAARSCYRTEVWIDTVQRVGLCSDGLHHRGLNGKTLRWDSISAEKFYHYHSGYDFRGHLYYWKTSGLEMEYKGLWNWPGGGRAHRIFVRQPTRFDRNYLFEEGSGLLFFIQDLPTHKEEVQDSVHADWRAVREYVPVGGMLLPSVEEYQAGLMRTTVIHSYRYLPLRKEIFDYRVQIPLDSPLPTSNPNQQ